MRLASADLLTAAAVIGTIDALSDRDAVVPDVDLTAPVPDDAEKNLVDLDLEELLELTISGKDVPVPPEMFDLRALDIEQLLALELDDVDLTPADLALLPLEDLLAIDVQADDPEPIRAPFDLTGIALEALQDIQHGEVGFQPQNPYRQVAELDLVKVEISLPEVNDISARISAPSAGDTTHDSPDRLPRPGDRQDDEVEVDDGVREDDEYDGVYGDDEDGDEDDGDHGDGEDDGDDDGGHGDDDDDEDEDDGDHGDDEDDDDEDEDEDDDEDGEDDGDSGDDRADEDEDDEDGNDDREEDGDRNDGNDDDDDADDEDNGGDGDDEEGDFSAVGLSSDSNLLFADDNADTFGKSPPADGGNLVPPPSAPADPVSLMPDDVVL